MQRILSRVPYSRRPAAQHTVEGTLLKIPLC
jgi:hypothetical protein